MSDNYPNQLVANGWMFLGMGVAFILGIMFGEIGRTVALGIGGSFVITSVGMLLIGYLRQRKSKL